MVLFVALQPVEIEMRLTFLPTKAKMIVGFKRDLGVGVPGRPYFLAVLTDFLCLPGSFLQRAAEGPQRQDVRETALTLRDQRGRALPVRRRLSPEALPRGQVPARREVGGATGPVPQR